MRSVQCGLRPQQRAHNTPASRRARIRWPVPDHGSRVSVRLGWSGRPGSARAHPASRPKPCVSGTRAAVAPSAMTVAVDVLGGVWRNEQKASRGDPHVGEASQKTADRPPDSLYPGDSGCHRTHIDWRAREVETRAGGGHGPRPLMPARPTTGAALRDVAQGCVPVYFRRSGTCPALLSRKPLICRPGCQSIRGPSAKSEPKTRRIYSQAGSTSGT